MKILIVFFSLVFSSFSFCDANEDGKSFASEMNISMDGIAKGLDSNDVPNYQGTEVDETDYYDDGLGIETEAKKQSVTDPTANFIYESRGNRPYYDLDKETDPLFKNLERITDQSNSLSESYSGCVSLPVGTETITSQEDKTCLVKGQREESSYSCTKTLEVSCAVVDEQQTVITEGPMYTDRGNGHGFVCTTNSPYCLLKWNSQNLSSSVTRDQMWAGVTFGEWTYKADSSQEAIPLPPMAGFQHFWYTFSVVRTKVGHNYICSEFNRTYDYACDVGEIHSEASLVSSVCIESGETRNVDGYDVYSDCWKWQQEYYKEGDPVYEKEAACTVLEEEGCTQTSGECIEQGDGYCITQELTYSCSTEVPATTIDMCGDDLICAGGSCTDDVGREQLDATEEFKKAATSMSVLNEIIDDFDYDNLSVFAGEVKRCEKASLDFNNCCSSGGWGSDIGLASCDAEEEELGLLREEKRTVYVGQYCSEDTFLGCVAHKQVYCSYPSKLARIIIEQGKLQLGDAYGTAENPNCEGFTLEEMEGELDFDAMDLTEFYDDAMEMAASSTAPNGMTVTDQIIQKIKSASGSGAD